MIDTIFFDLDGTLVDSEPDLRHAMNKLLAEHKLPPVNAKLFRQVVSLGGDAMLKQSFSQHLEPAQYQALKNDFLDYYHEDISQRSKLFPGITALLEVLESQEYNWGIITNKSTWLTTPLLERLELDKRAAIAVCGDTTSAPKPSPIPILYACDKLKVKPSQCIYVGDAERDIIAGRSAGMPSLVAMYGYINPTDDVASWQADALLSSPLELIQWLETHS